MNANLMVFVYIGVERKSLTLGTAKKGAAGWREWGRWRYRLMLNLPIHPASLPPEQLLAECDSQFLRRSGPGGQHRNKVATAVVLTHRPTAIRAEANERRSQAANRTVAIFRLRMNLALAIRTQPQAADPPSLIWQSRCRSRHITINPRHEDFPTLLAEALDTLALNDCDIAAAAERLGCTVSQLVKFLKKAPQAFGQVNRDRLRRDLYPLR
jgi:hypothetical protein